LDLQPVLAGAADRFGLAAVVVEDRLPMGNDAANDSLGVVLARDLAPLRSPPFDAAAPLAAHPRVLWTDDWSNLLELIR
jgi:hypothetical protein